MNTQSAVPTKGTAIPQPPDKPTYQMVPAWVRMPSQGRTCPVTGMKRGLLYALAAEGRIKTALISVNGKTEAKGARFINVESVMKLLEDSSQKKVSIPDGE